jgi:Glycosyltransferase Family 4
MSQASPRALIITYYWPPAGGGGVQRWLKFARYLPEFGWTPIVYVPENADYPLRDDSLEEEVKNVEVIKHPIWEVRRLYQWIAGSKDGGIEQSADSDNLFYKDKSSLSLKQRLALFIRSNFFIPDARSSWIKPSVRYLKAWLKENRVDAIITTGPPHSCHLIGLHLKRASGLPWIADFRDPWTDIEYFSHLNLTRRSRLKHERLQREVLTTADQVITVSWSWARLFERYGAKDVLTITNGYDPDDFADVVTKKSSASFVIASIGTLELDRNPKELWMALDHLIERGQPGGKKILVQLVGKVDRAIMDLVPDRIKTIVELTGYVPHARAVSIMRQADVLLLLQNRTAAENVMGRIPGKVFEYLAARKPILLIGDKDSDLAGVVGDIPSNAVCAFDDVPAIEKYLASVAESLETSHVSLDFKKYERRQLAETLALQIDDLVLRK